MGREAAHSPLKNRSPSPNHIGRGVRGEGSTLRPPPNLTILHSPIFTQDLQYDIDRWPHSDLTCIAFCSKAFFKSGLNEG